MTTATVSPVELKLIVRDHQPITTSRQISEVFKKRHDHVLDIIDNMLLSDPDLAADFSGATFEDRGRSYV